MRLWLAGGLLIQWLAAGLLGVRYATGTVAASAVNLIVCLFHSFIAISYSSPEARGRRRNSRVSHRVSETALDRTRPQRPGGARHVLEHSPLADAREHTPCRPPPRRHSILVRRPVLHAVLNTRTARHPDAPPCLARTHVSCVLFPSHACAVALTAFALQSASVARGATPRSVVAK